MFSGAPNRKQLVLGIYPSIRNASFDLRILIYSLPYLNISVDVDPKSVTFSKHLMRFISHVRPSLQYCGCSNIAQFIDSGTEVCPPECLVEVKSLLLNDFGDCEESSPYSL